MWHKSHDTQNLRHPQDTFLHPSQSGTDVEYKIDMKKVNIAQGCLACMLSEREKQKLHSQSDNQLEVFCAN